MRKILIVSYHFPPDAAVGSVRPAKFAKYLPQFGWEPIVLTVRERYHPLTDQSKLKDLDPALRVYRTRMLPQPGRFYLGLKSRLLGPTPSTDGLPARTSASSRPGVLSSIKRALTSLECLPDDKQIWVPVAVPIAAKIIRDHQVDAFLTTGPPMTCHVIGLLLKALTGRRWIADFRDPWILNPTDSSRPSTAFSRAIETWLEQKTMLNADSVVFNSDRMQASLQQRYPFLTSKTSVILNGYDPSDFNGGSIDACRRDRHIFTLTHTGTLYLQRSAEPLLRCFSELIHAGRIPRGQVRLNFVGYTPTVQARAEALDLADVVTVTDFMKYEECVDLMYRSDVLLLLAQGQPLQIPTKIYDYIAVGKRILVFAEDGATADLARRLPVATVVDSEDGEGLKATLTELYRQFQRGTLALEASTTDGLRRQLTKLELTRKLACLLN
jgi:glycosyltransferase involved in cell wall biosynthesis